MPAIKPGATVTLRGELEGFTVRTDDGWGTGYVRAEGFDEPVAITGKVLGARRGDALEMQGTWVEHPRYGAQFKIKNTIISPPQTLDGVAKWLASTLPGVGAVRAQALVEHFGGVEQLWAAIENAPASLCDIKGITTELAQRIHDEYTRNRDSRDHMIALRGWGLTDAQIQRCLQEWKTLDAVVKRIKQNPYELCQHVHGFGFKRADEVGRLAGIAHNDPQRIEAGIVYTLDEAVGDGHCFLFGGALQRIAADEVLLVTHDEVARGILRAVRSKMIVRRGKRIYSARLEVAEAKAASAVQTLILRSTPANDNAEAQSATDSKRTYH
jgi:exodeoxyribonuclease V alpha subunit